MADGGILTDAIEQAAQLAVLGLDPIRFLNTTDSTERNLLVEIGIRARRIADIDRGNLSKLIASEVSKIFKKS